MTGCEGQSLSCSCELSSVPRRICSASLRVSVHHRNSKSKAGLPRTTTLSHIENDGTVGSCRRTE